MYNCTRRIFRVDTVNVDSFHVYSTATQSRKASQLVFVVLENDSEVHFVQRSSKSDGKDTLGLSKNIKCLAFFHLSSGYVCCLKMEFVTQLYLPNSSFFCQACHSFSFKEGYKSKNVQFYKQHFSSLDIRWREKIIKEEKLKVHISFKTTCIVFTILTFLFNFYCSLGELVFI